MVWPLDRPCLPRVSVGMSNSECKAVPALSDVSIYGATAFKSASYIWGLLGMYMFCVLGRVAASKVNCFVVRGQRSSKSPRESKRRLRLKDVAHRGRAASESQQVDRAK